MGSTTRTSTTRPSLAGGIILSMALCLGFSAQKSQWKGTISHEGDVDVVKNPKKPAFGEGAFTIREDLSIGKPGGTDGYLFSHLWYLAVDDEENIYAMDQGETQVKVFDKKGIFLRTIGRKGAGPGELQNPNNIFISSRPELVVEDYIRNLTYYTPDGQYIRALSTVRIFPIGILLDSSGRIFALRNIQNPEKPGKEVDLYDQNLNFLKTIVTVLQRRPDPSLIEPFRNSIQWALLNDGSLVVSSGDEYELDVFNVEGKLVRKIIRDYDFVRITDEDVKQSVPRVPEGRKLVVPKNFPAIRSLTTDDEGRIFVGTYEKRGKGIFVNDVFDSAGRFVAAVALKGQPQVWKKHKLYAIEEDEDGSPFIQRYAATWTWK
jgi:6-bladed beta-propeller